MGMHIRTHRREDALMLARPEADKCDVLAVLFEWDLDFLMALHTGWSLGRRVDDMEVDQFGPTCHRERERLGQARFGTGFADVLFQFGVGLHLIRQFLAFPRGDFGPNKKWHARLVAFRHMDKAVGTHARQRRSAVGNRYLAR